MTQAYSVRCCHSSATPTSSWSTPVEQTSDSRLPQLRTARRRSARYAGDRTAPRRWARGAGVPGPLHFQPLHPDQVGDLDGAEMLWAVSRTEGRRYRAKDSPRPNHDDFVGAAARTREEPRSEAADAEAATITMVPQVQCGCHPVPSIGRQAASPCPAVPQETTTQPGRWRTPARAARHPLEQVPFGSRTMPCSASHSEFAAR